MSNEKDPCGKNSYPSEAKALRVAFQCWMKRNVVLRTYRCGRCRAWHLTKKFSHKEGDGR